MPTAARGQSANERPTLLPTGVAEAFDTAITRVAGREWERLSRGEKPEGRLNRVANALVSLQKLQSKDQMPDYADEWVALFYLLWYQPRQVYLAFRVLTTLLSERGSQEQPLRVIDLGCGALATAFGMAMAMAGRGSRNLAVPRDVSVCAIDPSVQMRRVGETLWEEFWEVLDEAPDLTCLEDAVSAMIDNHHFYTSHAEMADVDAGDECWLVAMHSVYESNRSNLRTALLELRDEYGVARTVVSSERLKADLVREVFAASSSTISLPGSSGRAQLPQLSAWRRRLGEELVRVDVSTAERRNLVNNYLSRIPVRWTSGSPFVLTDSPPSH